MFLQCRLGGQWSQSYIPACQEVYCGPVPQIDNGFAVVASNVTYRGVAQFQCYAGFAFPSGNPLESITCLDNGEWSPLPNCQGEQELVLEKVPSEGSQSRRRPLLGPSPG